MAITETTTVSWGSRLGSAFKGVLVGVILFLIAFPVLFLNEGRAVKATKTNKEGASSVVEALADKVDPAQEGCLIHVVGEATTSDVLTNAVYGVGATAFRLTRTTEMYQWVENSETTEEKKLGGKVERKTVYTYESEWCDSAVDSERFHDKQKINPPARCELGEKSELAKNATLGVRRLSERQIARISGAETLKTLYQPVTTNEFFEVSGEVPQPRIGDVRVTFTVVRAPKEITVVAAQKGDGFMSYTAKSTKSTIDHLMSGAIDAEGVFAAAERGNKMLTWLLRFGGFLLMFIGLSMVFKPLSVLADVVPFIGNLVSLGTGFIAALIACGASLFTIAVAWIFYRPLLGILLIAVATALVVFVVVKLTAKKKPSSGAFA